MSSQFKISIFLSFYLFFKFKIYLITTTLLTNSQMFGLRSGLFRSFHISAALRNQANDAKIPVIFVTLKGEEIKVFGKKGSNLLDVAHENKIDLEGACEASLSCSTCHLYIDPAFFKILPKPTDDESDMLDLAWGLNEWSRLGCQIILNEKLSNIRVTLPAGSNNQQKK